jgi:single-stranded-DNA-specific exonuclease
VFVLTKSEDGVKGSGRSIEGYNMYEHMSAHREFFTKFGGHKLAAGLSMREEDIAPLQKKLNEDSNLTEEDFCLKVHIDVPMPLSFADEKLARELSLLEPFGVGNPKPLFAEKNVKFTGGIKMGVNKNFARYNIITGDGKKNQLIFFGDLDKFSDFLDKKYGQGAGKKLYTDVCDYEVSVTYQLGLNTYRGKCEKQFVMQNYC